MFIFRQLRDSSSATYTYLIGSRASRAALLVDPVAEQSPLYLGDRKSTRLNSSH